MNILYHHRIASKDGQFVHIDEIITALTNQGHNVTLIGPALHEASDFGHDGGIVSKLKSKLPKFVYELMELGYSLVAAAKLIKQILKSRPDAIYERYNLYQPVGVIIAKMFNIPLMLEVNAPLKEERERFSGGLGMPKLAKWIEDFTWRQANAVLPVTNVLADHIRRAGVPDDRIHVIHNGVKESVVEKLAAKPVVQEGGVNIGFVGFMHLTCGVEQALEVLKEVGDSRFTLTCVGDGNVLPSLKEKAVELGVEDQVTFTGLVGRDKVLEHINAFDIALQPAVTAYASPLKMFEYMVMKTLIVAPNMPNVREILSEDSAVLFDPNKPNEFKAKLKFAMQNIDELATRRENAFQRIHEGRFMWELNAQRIVSLAERLGVSIKQP